MPDCECGTVSSITVTRAANGASGLKSEVLIVANECRRKVSGQKDRVRCEHIPRDVPTTSIAVGVFCNETPLHGLPQDTEVTMKSASGLAKGGWAIQ